MSFSVGVKIPGVKFCFELYVKREAEKEKKT